jgi:hypothetical protein
MEQTMKALFGSFRAAALLALFAGPALAHHGWSWTEDEYIELTGTVRDVYIGNPHATLDVEVDGEVWTVDLAPPRATTNAGFVEGITEPGDEVTVIGNRSHDASERSMKAVRVIVGGQTYDVYPNRVPTN